MIVLSCLNISSNENKIENMAKKSCRVSVVHLVHILKITRFPSETLNMLLEFRWEVNCSQHIWQWRYFFPHFLLEIFRGVIWPDSGLDIPNAIGLFRVTMLR